MPTSSLNKQCLNAAGNIIPCTTTELCPGWDDTFCIGSLGQAQAAGLVECRACEPQKEMWFSFDLHTYRGACVCANPFEIARTHAGGFVAAIILGYIMFMIWRRAHGNNDGYRYKK